MMGSFNPLAMVIPIFWLLGAIAVPVAVLMLLFRLVRAYEKRGEGARDVADRLARLEERVARIDERLSSH